MVNSIRHGRWNRDLGRWGLALLVLALLIIGRAGAQEAPQRPRIGLVLGGGGARGGAHVGVLKALAEQNIPIDYVAGTSMGAVVGSLFAVGLSPAEIEEIFRNMDWDDLFNDHPERPDRIFRRKQDASDAYLPLEWGWRGGLVMPNGIIAGQKFSFAFRDRCLYLSGYQGFDNLAYPFRAVATDLQTGQLFAADRGNLLKMVRASMSIPGVFPPVRWGEHSLVDGYLNRNVPVDVCLDMGADIIIAVDVAPLPSETDPSSFQTLMGVSIQKSIIFGRQNVDPHLEAAQVVIRPILEISTRDFKDTAEAIEPGYEAAMAAAHELKELALAPEAYAEHLRQHAHEDPGPLTVTEIRLANRTRASDKSILENIRQPVGGLLDLDRLKDDLVAIYDHGIYSLVDFSLEYSGPDEVILFIHAEEKYYAPHILNFGATYYGGSGNESLLDARIRWNWLEMNRLGAEQRTDLQAGHALRLRSEFYQPLTWNRVPFLALTGEYEDAVHDWYLEMRQWGDFTTQSMSLRPEVGMRLGRWGEVRGGFDYGYMRAAGRSGLALGEFKGTRGGWVASLQFDKLDLAALPSHGYSGYLKYRSGLPGVGEGVDYQRLEVKLYGARTWGRNTLHLNLEGGTAFDTDLPEFRMFTLGGMDRLTAYARDQFRGQDYVLGQLKWHHKIIGHASPFSTSWYLMTQIEAGNAWYYTEAQPFRDLRTTGSVGLVVTTLLGPLTTAYSRSTDGHDAAYVTLGFWSRPLARGME